MAIINLELLETLNLEELSTVIKLGLIKTETLNLSDFKKLKFNMNIIETPISLVDDLAEVSNIYEYFRWLFTKPMNESFSFEDDDNLDKIANGWSVTNGTVDLISEDGRPHIQKVTLGNNGKFRMFINIDEFVRQQKNFNLYFNLKPISGTIDLDIDAYYDTFKLRQVFHYKVKSTDYDNWMELFTKWEVLTVPLYNRIYAEFYGSNCEFYIDNFCLIKDYSSILNPTEFSFDDKQKSIEVYNQVKETNIYFILKDIKEQENIRCYWTVLNKLSLDYLKNIFNKKILIKTHDRKILVGKLVSMSVNYLPETKQKLTEVELQIQFF